MDDSYFQKINENIVRPLINQLVEEISVRVIIAIQNNEAREPEKLLTIAQVCEMFSISRPTLSSWVVQGHLIKYRVGTKTFFKNSEVQISLKSLRRYKTTKQLEEAALK